MKNKFFVYASTIKSLPKGFLVFIIFLLLVLIPLIFSLALITLAGSLIYFTIRNFLPHRKKEKIIKNHSYRQVISIDENGNIIK